MSNSLDASLMFEVSILTCAKTGIMKTRRQVQPANNIFRIRIVDGLTGRKGKENLLMCEFADVRMCEFGP